MPASIPLESEVGKPNKYRQRWMGALIGALFALMGIALFSGDFYIGLRLVDRAGLIPPKDAGQILELIGGKIFPSIGITFLLFILFGGLAGLGIIRAVQRKKNGMRVGFLYGFLSLFLAFWCGFNSIVLASEGWRKWMRLVTKDTDSYITIGLTFLCLSLILALVFGLLLGLSIEKLSKTLGYGIARESQD